MRSRRPGSTSRPSMRTVLPDTRPITVRFIMFVRHGCAPTKYNNPPTESGVAQLFTLPTGIFDYLVHSFEHSQTGQKVHDGGHGSTYQHCLSIFLQGLYATAVTRHHSSIIAPTGYSSTHYYDNLAQKLSQTDALTWAFPVRQDAPRDT